MSPLLKFAETYVSLKLKNYCREKISPDYIKFVDGHDIQTNLFRLGSEVRRHQSSKRNKLNISFLLTSRAHMT